MDFNRKINSGFLDLFYTFKFEDKDDYSKIDKFLTSTHCVVSNIKDNNVGFSCDYEEYTQFCVSEINKRKIDALNNIESKIPNMQFKAREDINFDFSRKYETNIVDEEIVVTVSIDNKNPFLQKHEWRTYEQKFLEQKLFDITRYINENFMNLDTNVEDFLKVYIIQPMKVSGISDHVDEKYINIYLWLYSSGCLTIQFTVPINNSTFGNWTQPEQNKFDLKIMLPSYIENSEHSKEYIYSDKEYYYEEGIHRYKQYIIGKLNRISNLERHESKLNLFTLIDYDGLPMNFDSIPVKNSIIKDLFWIVHSPFGYLNDVTKTTYNKFLDERYELSKYISVFAGTQSKLVIAWNKSTNDLPQEVKEVICDDKYAITMSYVLVPIQDLLMKTVYCNSILNKPFDKLTSKKDIINRQEDIIYIKDYVFSIKRYSHESTNKMSIYLQNTLSNFLKIDSLDDRIKIYKEIVELKESEESSNNTFFLSFFAIIVTLLLGVDAIDKLTKLIRDTFNIDFTSYNFIIWSFLIIFLIVIFIYLKFKHKLKCFTHYIKIKFKSIKKFIRNRLISN